MKVMGGLEVRRLLKKISGEWGYFKANRQVAITCRLFSNMWFGSETSFEKDIRRMGIF